MASYAEDTPVQADRAKRTLAFASATSSEAPTPAGPPLSPYRDPSANCDPSEAPTPVRERRRESPPPDEPENAEEESLRLALELQEREERYAREQEEGAARHAELSQRRRERRRLPTARTTRVEDRGSKIEDCVGSMATTELTSSMSTQATKATKRRRTTTTRAWRFSLAPPAGGRRPSPAMAMNGGIEPPEGATERSLSPSQMTYDQLLH